MADTPNDSKQSDASKSDEKILAEARERFKLCEDAESDIRQLSLDDIKFCAGEQWPEGIKAEREQDGRPTLVINKTAQQVNQITNDQRQNRPAIKVNPVDDYADIEKAKVRQGLIRHIEYDSNADIAYSNGYEYAVTGGFGGWRVDTAYVSPTSFQQKARIRQIENPFAFYLDPYHKEPDGSDAEYGFIFEDLSKAEYVRLYPDSKLTDRTAWETAGNQFPKWTNDKGARVAEYFYKDYKKDKLLLLEDGSSILRSKLEKLEIQEPVSIVDERDTMVPIVRWCKINGSEILAKTDFPGKYIPIIPVYGKRYYIDGKRVVKGLVRDAKDPARQYNYMASAETEAIALAPKAPFIADPKQMEGYESIWAQANRKNLSYLPYNMVVNGQVLPPPQRASSDVSTQAITQARMLSSDDLKAATGIYDAALGAQSNEKSGIAIQRRNAQSQTSNFHFIDNLNRSIRHTGRILNEIIPEIYDTAQTARILGEEGDQRVVRINDPAFVENGKPVNYDMTVGEYDVTIDTGPSFQTKRQEAASAMLELSKTAPQMMQIAPDLVVKNLDFAGANEMAERFKKGLPPEFQDDKQKENPIPPQVQAQLEQSGQLIEQLTAQVNQLQDEKDQKLVEIESKERIEMAKLQTTATIELAKLESNEAIKLLAHQIAELDARMNQVGFNQPFPDGESNQSPEQFLNPQQIDGGGESAMSIEEQPLTGELPPGLPMEGN